MKCRVNESYGCLLGESLAVGLPAYLVRFSGCNLDCRYCDTAYARTEPGEERSVDDILAQVRSSGLGRVLLTGGEPMLQADAVVALCQSLVRDRVEVLVETNGTLPLDRLPSKVVKVVDVKTPGALPGASPPPFLDANLECLGGADQLKVVLSSIQDYDWAVAFLAARSPLPLPPANVLFSPAWGQLGPAELADRMLQDRLPFRFHLQVHKVVWGERRGT